MQQSHTRRGYGMTLSACLWLGIFPLLQGGTYAHITYDKWIIMLVLAAVTLCCFLFDRIHFHILRKKGSVAGNEKHFPLVPLLLAAALLFWTVLSCLRSDYSSVTWWLGESARMEGLATQLCYLGIFVCFLFARIDRRPVLISSSLGITVFLVIVLQQRAGGNPLGLYPSGRSYELNPEFQGTIGNVDMGTGYVLLLAGFFLYAFFDSLFAFQPSAGKIRLKEKEGRHPVLSVISLISFLITLYLIVTMDVQFGIISLAVLFLFTLLRFLPKKARLSVLILLIILALIVVWFWPGHSGGLWELHEVLHGRTRLSFGSNRIAVWYYSLLLAKDHLLIGGGSGTFVARFNNFLASHGYIIPSEQDGLALPDYFDTPHNEYIAQLTDHGLPAMLLFIALLFIAIFRRREGWFPCLSPYSAAVLCYAVQAFFSFSVCLVAPMFWVILALSFTEPE